MDNEFPLSGVVAYVETRLESVDISADIAKELIALGASIEQSIKKNVTHLIFREGTLTSWLSAHDKGLHIVSVSWIKFCKDHKVHAPENLFRPDVPEKTMRCRFVQALGPESSRKRVSAGKPRQSYGHTGFNSSLISSAIISPSFPTMKRFVTPPSMRLFRDRMERRKSTPGVCPITFDLSDSDNDEIMSEISSKSSLMKSSSEKEAPSTNSKDSSTTESSLASENITTSSLEIPNSAPTVDDIGESLELRHEIPINGEHLQLKSEKKSRRSRTASSLKPYSRPRIITRSVSKASEIIRPHTKL